MLPLFDDQCRTSTSGVGRRRSLSTAYQRRVPGLFQRVEQNPSSQNLNVDRTFSPTTPVFARSHFHRNTNASRPKVISMQQIECSKYSGRHLEQGLLVIASNGIATVEPASSGQKNVYV